MYRRKHIRSLLSGFLLLVFALAITPKKFLHFAFASHTDNTASASKTPAISVSGFNCDTDNLVAEPNFECVGSISILPVVKYGTGFIETGFAFSCSSVLSSHLRGPPATV